MEVKCQASKSVLIFHILSPRCQIVELVSTCYSNDLLLYMNLASLLATLVVSLIFARIGSLAAVQN
jgi:hypothetical protein